MYIHMYNFGEVRARTRIQFLFPVDFGAHVYFQLIIHRSQNLVDFLPLSMPSAQKGMEWKKYSMYCEIHEISWFIENFDFNSK